MSVRRITKIALVLLALVVSFTAATAAFAIVLPQAYVNVLTVGSAPGWFNTDVEFTITGVPRPGQPLIANKYYQINGGEVTTYTAPVSLTDEGTTTVTATVVDTAGTWSNPRSQIIQIDKTAPTIFTDLDFAYVATASVNAFGIDNVSGVASVEVNLDNTGWITSYGFETTIVGPHHADIRVTDNAGNVSMTGNDFTVFVSDTFAPISTAISPTSTTGWFTSPVDVGLTATDSPLGAVTGVGKAYYRLNGGAVQTYYDWSLYGSSRQTTVTVSDEGTNTLEYWAVDNMGNVEATQSLTIQIDKTGPQLSSDNTTEYALTAHVNLAASDGLSGVDYLEYALDNGSWIRGNQITSNVPGGHGYRFRAVDKAGNVTTSDQSFFDVWPIPQAVKNLRVQHGEGSYWFGQWEYPGWATKAWVWLDHNPNPSPHPSNALNVTNGTTWYDFNVLDGIWYLHVQTSNPGCDGPVSTVKFIADTTTPTTTLNFGATPNDSGWFRSPVQVSLTATDAGTGVAQTFSRVNTEAPTTYSSTFTVSTEGTNTLDYWSVDNTGNVETTKSATIKIDTGAPTLSLNATGSYTASATISASAADLVSGLDKLELKLDNGLWVSIDKLTSSSVGTHTVYARATDKAGNETTTSASFILHPTPPKVYSTKVTISATGSVKKGKSYAVKATMSPSSATGTAKFVFQLKKGKGKWTTKKTVSVKLVSGKATTSYKPTVKSSKTYSWHVVVSYGGATSATKIYKTSSATKAFTVK